MSIDIKTILEKHAKWLNDEEGGEQANLRGAYLREADLYEADLREADLREANLRGANLRGADLREANLRGANLCGAYLYGANLRGADLRGADLREADLREANLRGANLCGAYLYGADLREAYLREADLYGADLREADLREAYLCGAYLCEADLSDTLGVPPIACPEKGSFIAYKKVLKYDGSYCLVELLVRNDALRSSATTRKCRCSKAKVLCFLDLNGEALDITKCYSIYDKNFVYELDKTVSVDNFDTDRWNECAPGIHFFLSRQEAADYIF